jgi:hypothetical protein
MQQITPLQKRALSTQTQDVKRQKAASGSPPTPPSPSPLPRVTRPAPLPLSPTTATSAAQPLRSVVRPQVNDATQVSLYTLTQLFRVMGFIGKGRYGFVFIATPTRFAIINGVVSRELADRLYALKVELERGDMTNATEATVYALVNQRSECTKFNMVKAYFWTRVMSANLIEELKHINFASHVEVPDRPLYTTQKAYSVTLQERLTGSTIGALFNSSQLRWLTVHDPAVAPQSAWDSRAAVVMASVAAQLYAQLDVIRFTVSGSFTHNDLHVYNAMLNPAGIPANSRNYWGVYPLRDGRSVVVVPFWAAGDAPLCILDFGYARGQYNAVLQSGTGAVFVAEIRRGALRDGTELDATFIPLKYAEQFMAELRNGALRVAAHADQLLGSIATLLSVLDTRDYEFEKAARLLTRANNAVLRLSLVDGARGEPEQKMVKELARSSEVAEQVEMLVNAVNALMRDKVRPAFLSAGRRDEYAHAYTTYTGAQALLAGTTINRFFAAAVELCRIRDAALTNNVAFVTQQDFYTRLLAGPIVESLRTSNDPDSIRAKQQELQRMFEGVVPVPSGDPVNIIVPRVDVPSGALQFVATRIK